MDELPPDLLQWMRFFPSHKKAIEILISKIIGNCKGFDFIFEAEKSNLEPLDLKNLCLASLHVCGIKMEYPEWWFFSPPNRKGKGMERSTESGFWKLTGDPKEFKLDSVLLARKDILVFHEGRGKKGKPTGWVIHQYQITLDELDGTRPGQRPFLLNRFFYQEDESRVQNFKYAELAVPFRHQALEVQATTTPENIGKTISTTITPVDRDGKSFSTHAAENQFGELTALSNCNQNGYNATASEFQDGFGESDLQVPIDWSLSSPLISDMHFGISHSVSNDYNSHCGTSSEYGMNELSKFGDKFPDLASDYLSENFPNLFGCQKDLPLVSMKDNGSCSGLDAIMGNESFQDGFGESDLQVPIDWSLSSPLTSDIYFGISHSVSNDYNSHCGTSSEYGMNELSKFGDKFPDLASDYLSENFPNLFGCQKDLPLVSMKDNGSCSGLDAIMGNESFQDGFGESDLQVPIDWILSLPLTSDMHFGISHSVSNDYKSHCGMSSEYGMNELSKFGDKFPDLASDYLSENFPNMCSCQKDLPLVSMKDNGSCNGLDAIMGNESFESTFQGSGESRKRKASSGLLNLESPHGINGKVFKSDLGSDFIPKNY
ncbi:hypothetical protein I3842_05G201000 [Carya illinoinensis]|uniref:NAC domain-containing protein n=1 Tax=Carya illinoinensis TaxID=32201 RepID=A0A922F5T2_CARIL|nr:hypothetical protein I3842_05G201000 [Carya illinoinensis]